MPADREHAAYRGFAGGVFSGVAKLIVGHPFDTIKVRLQTNPKFTGPIDCLKQTLRNEGFRGVYKGASPPLVGWMFMDSLMLGSLHHYRAVLKRNFFAQQRELPVYAHGLAGIAAGWTVSFIAAPIEHVKARLQVQYHAPQPALAALKSAAHRTPPAAAAAAGGAGPPPRYTGPIHCTTHLLRTHGLRGLYHGLSATLLFRTWFFAWWGSYEVFTRALRGYTELSAPAVNFWAGGMSAQVFWTCAYPVDVVKQRVMTGGIGRAEGGRGWWGEARGVYKEAGARGFYRGFAPCILRAFPANAAALVVFEAVVRYLP